MHVRLKTWRVFSMILTDEERARAFERCNSKKLFETGSMQKRNRTTMEKIAGPSTLPLVRQ
jgi:hypothetical protein